MNRKQPKPKTPNLIRLTLRDLAITQVAAGQRVIQTSFPAPGEPAACPG